MKILISGGHLTPALALIDFVKTNHPQDEIVFVGRIYSQSKIKQLAQEKKEVTQRKIKFVPLNAIRFSKTKSFIQKLLTPLLFSFSIIKSFFIFIKEKPSVFISFGGYLALPLSIAAKLTNTPVITHEQTHFAGIANQLIAKFADKIAISHPTSFEYFPQNKTILTGNLIRPELLKKTSKRPKWINSSPSKPILLVTGGNQGSWVINQIIKQSLNELTKKWTVIHLCGQSNPQNNYRVELQSEVKKLPAPQQKNYFVEEWVNAQDLSWIYDHTEAAISRAGANTVMELTYKKIPTIFIPLPISRHDEQKKNALFLLNQEAAVVINQENLSSKSLEKKLSSLEKKHSQISKNLDKVKVPTDAAQLIYQLMVDLSNHEA